MRKRRLLGIALLLSVLTCDTGLDTFEVQEEAQADIPGNPLGGVIDAVIPFGSFSEMNLSESQELKNQGVEPSDIDSVRITSLTLTLTEPPGGDFTFLDSLEFFVEAEGEPRRRIADANSFVAGDNTLSMHIEDVDLKPYAVKDSMSITTAASGSSPTEDTHIEAIIELEVDVDVSGAVCGG